MGKEQSTVEHTTTNPSINCVLTDSRLTFSFLHY